MINRLFNKCAWGVEVNPETPATNSIIWMHGLGASCEDFLPLVEQLTFAAPQQARFLFPNAPIRPITVNQGMKMRAWYDVKNLEEFLYSKPQTEQYDGLDDSQAIITGLIEQELSRGINSRNIILAGFSQGGAMAIHSGLRFNQPLGGIICLSGYLPKYNTFPQERTAANQGTKIFMAHGLYDPIVSIDLASHSCDTLINLNYNVSWHTYPMQHMVMPQEINDINAFLNNLFAT